MKKKATLFQRIFNNQTKRQKKKNNKESFWIKQRTYQVFESILTQSSGHQKIDPTFHWHWLGSWVRPSSSSAE